ncbi:MAG: hypothetical protein ABW171_07045 [Steroidobacter sp.]
MTRAALTLLLILMMTVGAAQSAELTVLVEGEHIGARLQSLGFPDSLRKDLRSGLTNKLLLRVTMQEGERVLATSNARVELQYDLWDKRFRTELSINGTASSPPELHTVEEALAWLHDLRLPRLFLTPASTQALTLQAQVLLNPIERERMERIREWVKDNSSYVPLESATRGTSPETGANAVFNRIFEQYVAGEDLAAQWRQEVVSSPFSSKRP